MTHEEIDALAGNGFVAQLNLPDGRVHTERVDNAPIEGTVFVADDGKSIRVVDMFHRRGKELFYTAKYSPDGTLATPKRALDKPDPGPALQWAIAHRDSRKAGPRPLATWALFRFLGEWGGRVADDATDAPPELRELCDRLNALDGKAEWTDFEATGLHFILLEPGRLTGDMAARTDFMSRRIEARRNGAGGLVCDAILAKDGPTLHRVLNDLLGPRPLMPAEQAEADRKAAAEAARIAAEEEAKAEAERRAAEERSTFEAMLADAGEALDTTDRRRAAALVNVIFVVTQWKRPDTLADLLEAEDDLDEVAAIATD